MSDDQKPKDVWLTVLVIIAKIIVILVVGVVAVFGLLMGACYFAGQK